MKQILRSHEVSPYVLADVFFGPNRDTMNVIDTTTLELAQTLRLVPGAEARALGDVRRLPARKPSGRCNLWNNIGICHGTGR